MLAEPGSVRREAFSTHAFQLNLPKSLPTLKILNYTEKSYGSRKEREMKLAEGRRKRRLQRKIETRNSTHCSCCAIANSGLPRGFAPRQNLQDNEEGDTTQCAATTAPTLESFTNAPAALSAQPLGPALPDDTMCAIDPFERQILPAQGSLATTGHEFVKPRVTRRAAMKNQSHKKLKVRLKLRPTLQSRSASGASRSQLCILQKRIGLIANDPTRHDVRSSRMTRELPDSKRSGRKRYRPNRPFEDGY